MHVALAKKKKDRRENIIHSARALSAASCLVCKSRILLSVELPAFLSLPLSISLPYVFGDMAHTRRRTKWRRYLKYRRVTTLGDLICRSSRKDKDNNSTPD